MVHLAREARQLRAQCERLGGTVSLTGSRWAWAAELGLTHAASAMLELRDGRGDGVPIRSGSDVRNVGALRPFGLVGRRVIPTESRQAPPRALNGAIAPISPAIDDAPERIPTRVLDRG